MFFVSCVSHAFASVHCCLVVTCWESTDLFALVGDMYYILVTFTCGILGQVWYLNLSFPCPCRLSYLVNYDFLKLLFISLKMTGISSFAAAVIASKSFVTYVTIKMA